MAETPPGVMCKQPRNHTMTVYQELIAKATGLTDANKIDQVEQYMRQVFFRSTISWQTEEQLTEAAEISAQELEIIGWNFR